MLSQERAIWARWVDIKDIMIMLWACRTRRRCCVWEARCRVGFWCEWETKMRSTIESLGWAWWLSDLLADR